MFFELMHSVLYLVIPWSKLWFLALVHIVNGDGVIGADLGGCMFWIQLILTSFSTVLMNERRAL